MENKLANLTIRQFDDLKIKIGDFILQYSSYEVVKNKYARKTTPSTFDERIIFHKINKLVFESKSLETLPLDSSGQRFTFLFVLR